MIQRRGAAFDKNREAADGKRRWGGSWDGGGGKRKLDRHSINTGGNEQAGWLAGPFSQGGPSVRGPATWRAS